jgi:mono/diheme cytochrome c family protein
VFSIRKGPIFQCTPGSIAPLTAVAFVFLFVFPRDALLQAQDAQLDKAPAAAKSVKNPYSTEAGAAEAGSKVYAANCTKCHGVDAKGTGMVPSLLKAAPQSATDGTLFWFITQGDADDGMPPWARLPAKQRWEVVAFIKSLGASQAKPATDSP